MNAVGNNQEAAELEMLCRERLASATTAAVLLGLATAFLLVMNLGSPALFDGRPGISESDLSLFYIVTAAGIVVGVAVTFGKVQTVMRCKAQLAYLTQTTRKRRG